MLVVDDNATNRRIFEKMLEKWQMRATLVDNGPDAVNAVHKAGGGANRSRWCSSSEHARHGRIHGGETDGRGADSRTDDHDVDVVRRAARSVRCRKLGIASYLVKPVRQAALCQAILETLGRAARNRYTAPAPRHLPRRSGSAGRRQRRESAGRDRISKRPGTR